MKRLAVGLLLGLTVSLIGCAETLQNTRVAVQPIQPPSTASAEVPVNLVKWREGLTAEEFRGYLRDCLYIVYDVDVVDHNNGDKLVEVLFSYAAAKGFDKRQWALATELLFTECDRQLEVYKNKKLTQQTKALPLHSK